MKKLYLTRFIIEGLSVRENDFDYSLKFLFGNVKVRECGADEMCARNNEVLVSGWNYIQVSKEKVFSLCRYGTFFPNITSVLTFLFAFLIVFQFNTVSVSYANKVAAQKWVENEFQPSTLSLKQQKEEMDWFIQASKPFQGMEIVVLSETIPTHAYEANVLAKAFEEITGIKVRHELKHEGDVVEIMNLQALSEHNIYDAYVNDSDFIGTHYRQDHVYPVYQFLEGSNNSYTLPSLDLEDFIGKQFVSDYGGRMYQLPDQQFANLYWYRHDWFVREDLQTKFRNIYGYDLGVPVNWSAYEDIAEFFSIHVKEIDGVRVYGHLDWGKPGSALNWRLTDSWLSMAGVGDTGMPNGFPVDDWGIRADGCHPVGASVSRGGAIDSPAAIYAVKKYVEWLRDYAPENVGELDTYDIGRELTHGTIAQQLFWYSYHARDLLDSGDKLNHQDGSPKWRMAPSPHGVYWKDGQKLGYQDVGSWTFLKSTPEKRRIAAWLYAQFVVSKTVSLKKTLVGLTPIRDSDIWSDEMSDIAPKLGGLVEFYRSRARYYWTPTGLNVPNYPKLSPVWGRALKQILSRNEPVEQVMRKLAAEIDAGLLRLERQGSARCAPRLNEPKDEHWWLANPGSPKAELANEKPLGQTIAPDQVMSLWEVDPTQEDSDQIDFTIVQLGAPFSHIQGDSYGGVYWDFAKKIKEELGEFNINLRMRPAKRAYAEFRANLTDVIFPVYGNDQNVNIYDTSASVMDEKTILVCHDSIFNNSARDNWPADFLGLRIGVDSVTANDQLKVLRNFDLRIEHQNLTKNLLDMLMLERIDCAISSNLIFLFEMSILHRSDKLPTFLSPRISVASDLYERPVMFGFSVNQFHSNLQFKQAFDAVLKKVIEDNTLALIIQRQLREE